MIREILIAGLCMALGTPALANPPIPPRKPERDAGQADTPPMPPRRPERRTAKPIPIGDPCNGALAGLAVEAQPLAPFAEGACGRKDVVLVRAVGTNRAIPLAAPATLSCAMTVSLAKWVGTSVAPVANALLGSDLASLPAGISYACRTRNHQADAKLSEHAFANAFDISGFKLADGRTVPVAPHEGASAQDLFLTRIRTDACGPFTTVLGPGSDIYHADHFHLDTAERRNPWCK